MLLTEYDLTELQKNCDNLSHLIKDIKQSYNPNRTERQLFKSRQDYSESLKLKNQSPQDFYYFRFFDVFVQVVFHKQKKHYLIYIDGFYSKVLDKYERMDNGKSYIISQSFDITLQIYQLVINDILENKVLKNELF